MLGGLKKFSLINIKKYYNKNLIYEKNCQDKNQYIKKMRLIQSQIDYN